MTIILKSNLNLNSIQERNILKKHSRYETLLILCNEQVKTGLTYQPNHFFQNREDEF